MNNNEETKINAYIVYAILFVIILILAGVTITFAYFKAQTSNSSTPTNLAASVDCFDISYSEENTIINLDYNYPITDEFALANVTPVTIKVTNNCAENIADVDYTLAITSLSNNTGYISDNKIRTSVTRTIESESTFVSEDYLSNLTPLEIGAAYTSLNNDLDAREAIRDYATRTSYVIDSSSISNKTTIIYKVYLWVDYYEGDAEAYNGAEHDETFDNTTEGQQFAAAISLLVNSSAQIEHRLPDEYQEVEYIESNGTQYLELDFKANQDTITRAKYQIIDTTKGSGLFGSGAFITTNFYSFNWGGFSSSRKYFNVYYQSELTDTTIDSEIHTLVKNKATLYIDNQEISTNEKNGTDFTTPHNMIVFGMNTNGTIGSFSSAKIFYLQFYENDTLKIDLVPCYRKSDSEVGMYDLANDVFYTNKGSSYFATGHKVS